MEKNLYTVSIEEIQAGSEVLILTDHTWKKIAELLSEKKDSPDALLYFISIDPVLMKDGTSYDSDAFATSLQRYIEHIQRKNPDISFRLVVERKNNITDSFYAAVWNLLTNYADTIVVKSNNNSMILVCD
jgi:hypothetical protein